MANDHVHPVFADILERFAAPPVRQVRSVPCCLCGGTGWIESGVDYTGVGYGRPCRRCSHGVVEIEEAQ